MPPGISKQSFKVADVGYFSTLTVRGLWRFDGKEFSFIRPRADPEGSVLSKLA